MPAVQAAGSGRLESQDRRTSLVIRFLKIKPQRSACRLNFNTLLNGIRFDKIGSAVAGKLPVENCVTGSPVDQVERGLDDHRPLCGLIRLLREGQNQNGDAAWLRDRHVAVAEGSLPEKSPV